MIFEKQLREHLAEKTLTLRHFDLIDSTNAEAKRQAPLLAAEGNKDPVLFLAQAQSAGRGRMGRPFLSREGQGLFFSLLYFTDQPLSDAVSITTAAAAVTATAIELVTGEPMRIKWVNDIYNHRGKVSGILAETLQIDQGYAVVVGIGINTGKEDFPEELCRIASSVGDLDGKEALLVARIVNGLLAHGQDPTERSYMQAYRDRFMLTGASVDLFQNGERMDCGTVLGVDDEGGLLFRSLSGQDQVIHSGEVSVRDTAMGMENAEFDSAEKA